MNKAVDIILHLRHAEQALISTGSLFYGKRLLTHEAEEFIIEETTSKSQNASFCLKLYLHPEIEDRAQEISTAIHQHFAYRRMKSRQQLKQAFQLGWSSLLTAAVFLGILISLTLTMVRPKSGLVITVQEFLIILGWVALWRPADLLLYEWRPFKREVNLFRKLEECRIEVVVEKL